MKVLIDGNTLGNNRTGIGNYTYSLLKELGRMTTENLSITVALREKVFLAAEGDLEFGKVNTLKTKEKNMMKYLPIPAVHSKGYDLYHEPNYIQRAFSGKTVITIHDMSHRLFPQYHPKKRVLKLKLYESVMKRADHIITVSHNSKEEIMQLLKVPEERITVTYEGASEAYSPLNLSAELKGRLTELYKLPEQFILYVGTIEPRKNLANLIEAYWRYKKEDPSSQVKLVLAGGKGWLYDKIFARVRELKLENYVVFTGYVKNEELPVLYNMAEAFVYPSLYEGFGLPPLEAMACGTPVISSNNSSIPEVVGDAGLLVDPRKVSELAEAIYKVLSSKDLRLKMSQKGLSQASKFSWKKCAEETLAVYRQCLEV